MKKRILSIIICSVLALSLLAGCGSKEEPIVAVTDEVVVEEEKAEASTDLVVTITNDSGYVFNEIYISPTSDFEWGDDQLDSTSILKSGGSTDITIEATSNGLYDFEAIDEDGDSWFFERIPVDSGTELHVSMDEDEVVMIATSSDDTEVVIIGQLNYSYEEGDDASVSDDWIEMTFYNYTDFTFYEIYIKDHESEDIGYNHIESIGSFLPEETCEIGVDYAFFHDMALVDEDDDVWLFEKVDLVGAYAVDITYDGDMPSITVFYDEYDPVEYEGTFE
ncbi:MAG: hypothetical protein ACK5LL_02150 [Suipraeoptans sp.]